MKLLLSATQLLQEQKQLLLLLPLLFLLVQQLLLHQSFAPTAALRTAADEKQAAASAFTLTDCKDSSRESSGRASSFVFCCELLSSSNEDSHCRGYPSLLQGTPRGPPTLEY